MSGGVRSKGNSGELDRANKTGHARHHMGWGVDLLGPPWNFKTDAMDNWQDNLLRTDPTTLHTWCQGFPCGATAQVQARAQGQPFKEDFTTGRRYNRERASTLREPVPLVYAHKNRGREEHVYHERIIPDRNPPQPSVHGSSRVPMTRARAGDDWLRNVAANANRSPNHRHATHYRLNDGRRTPITTPRGPTVEV